MYTHIIKDENKGSHETLSNKKSFTKTLVEKPPLIGESVVVKSIICLKSLFSVVIRQEEKVCLLADLTLRPDCL